MEDVRAKVTTIKTSLLRIKKQVYKDIVDIPRQRTRISAIEETIDGLERYCSNVEPSEETESVLGELQNAQELIEDLFLRCSILDDQKRATELEINARTQQAMEEQRLSLEREKLGTQQTMEEQRLSLEREKLETNARTQLAMEKDRLASERALERDRLEASTHIEQQRLILEREKLEIQARADSERMAQELKLAQLKLQRTSDDAAGAGDNINTSNQTPNKQYGSGMLHKLQVPNFDGNPLTWLNFKDLFLALVGENPGLTASQRLQYLKLALVGEPAQLIKNLPSTNANFDLAWGLLNDRYNSARDLVSAYIKRLLDLPVQVKESSEGIRKIADTTREIMRSLDLLNRTQTLGQDIVTYLLSQRLSPETRKDWTVTLQDKEPPELDHLLKFLERRAEALHSASNKQTDFKSSEDSDTFQRKQNNNKFGKKKFVAAATENKKRGKCAYCDIMDHLIYQCRAFAALTPVQRKDWVAQRRRCFRCLTPSHHVRECKSKHLCAVCHMPHNTLVHTPTNDSSSAAPVTGQIQQPATNFYSANSATNLNPMSASFVPHISACSTEYTKGRKEQESTETLLFTAQVLVKARNGRFYNCRALLDCGSQSSLITENAARQLWLPRRKSKIDISGVNNTSPARNLGEVDLCIRSKVHEQFQITTSAIVLPRLTSNLPVKKINGKEWAHLQSLKLADVNYWHPAGIDLILGQDIFTKVILPETMRGGENQPTAFNSHLGWLLGGTVPTATGTEPSTVKLVHHSLNFLLQRFWETESIPNNKPPSKPADRWAEEHFAETFERLDDGSLQVRLPIINDVSVLGESQPTALRRFQAVEKRLDKNPELKSQYVDFMKEYEDLGHMKLVQPDDVVKGRHFIPHHPVIKTDSITTKLRVVFDASAVTESGVSLNDVLAVGPTVQPELFDTLIKYRTHKYTLNSDFVKMYRSFKLHPDDRYLQNILWRADPSQPVKIYELQTVTYGLRPSAFLATRALLQLAREESERFPMAAKVLREQMYIDDILSGGESVEEVHQLRVELEGIAHAGCLQLNKWASNNDQVLADLYGEDVIVQSPLNLDYDDVVKILGVSWFPMGDHFSVRVTPPLDVGVLSKRLMVGHLARLFDPLGFLTPIIVWAKILIQKLWLLKIGWDDQIPADIAVKWKMFQEQLCLLSALRIPRFVGNKFNGVFELIGFCDASLSGFCACIYARLLHEGTVRCILFTAKSKVAPLKTLSVPRLELCSAVLLSQLISRISANLSVQKDRVKLFSDSQIVLSWLNSPPTYFNVFVSNRVAEIQDLTEGCQWHFVPSELNPADLGTRGVLPMDIVNSRLWFQGPPFLHDINFDFSKMIFQGSNIVLPERRQVVLVIEASVNDTGTVDTFVDLTTLCSSFAKLQRVTAYIFRFVANCRTKIGPKRGGSLTLSELETATYFLIRKVQKEHFSAEIAAVRRGVNISANSSLVSLCPHLDEHNILRVTGRLNNAPISPRRKFPIILPRKGAFTSLIVTSSHVRRHHAGATSTLAFIRLTYWVIGGLSAVKAILRRCVVCARHRTDVTTQLMGPLPACRVWPNPTFSVVGTDFAGPMLVRAFKGRKFAVGKAYICIFVCMSTKAVHLELVSGLSTSDFLCALRRFVARRGLCKVIYSDHGTNFVGAKRELRTILREAIGQSEEHIRQQLTTDGIAWHFTPVESPHFGGVWEGNIKIVKQHLVKISGAHHWTVEQLTTILCEVEACLNSRPLCPLSNSPDELEALTPAHFIIGRSMAIVPAVQETVVSPIQNYRLLSAHVQQFWNRWSREYLSLLLTRPKWRHRRAQVRVGDMVVVKDRVSPPSKWRLGRVLGVLPGSDGLVRVVTIRTQGGLIQRAINNIIVLFNKDE